LRQALRLPVDSEVAAFFESLNAELGLPRGLRAMGVSVAVLDEMAEKAAKDHSTATNPRAVDADGYRAIFRAACETGHGDKGRSQIASSIKSPPR
jgi:4-hydroxybutyrate dehydrogenase